MTEPNCRVLAENLYKAVKAVKRTKISTLPVLNYAWLRTEEGRLVVSTVDFITSPLTETCAARVNVDFSTCVPMVLETKVNHNKDGYFTSVEHKAKFYPFLDWLKVMQECEDVLDLYFDPSTQILTVKADKSTTEFKCLDAREFPPVDIEEEGDDYDYSTQKNFD